MSYSRQKKEKEKEKEKKKAFTSSDYSSGLAFKQRNFSSKAYLWF
jgi:hypothetical protein